MTIEQRLERLESQNRRLKWTVAAIVTVAVVGCVGGAVISEDYVPAGSGGTNPAVTVVQAGRFEVVDAEGNVVAAMSINRDRTGGVVFTNNKHGALVAQMGAADDERGVVWTYDRDGYPRRGIR